MVFVQHSSTVLVFAENLLVFSVLLHNLNVMRYYFKKQVMASPFQMKPLLHHSFQYIF